MLFCLNMRYDRIPVVTRMELSVHSRVDFSWENNNYEEIKIDLILPSVVILSLVQPLSIVIT